MTVNKPNRFGDLNRIWEDVENWTEIEDITGQEIVVYDAVQLEGKYGKYVAVKFTFEGDQTYYGFSTGSGVVMKKVLTAKEKGYLPLPGKIVKEKRYYDIV